MKYLLLFILLSGIAAGSFYDLTAEDSIETIEFVDETEHGPSGTSVLNMSLVIACQHAERGNYPVYGESSAWYDGDQIDDYPAEHFENEFDICSLQDAAGQCAYGWSSEPFIDIDLYAAGFPQDIRFFRYEGTCRPLVKIMHEKFPAEGSTDDHVNSPESNFLYYTEGVDDEFPGHSQYMAIPLSDLEGCPYCNYKVDWDSSQTQCEGIGGAWLDTEVADPQAFQDRDGKSFRCCGDDWIWLYNRPLDYAATKGLSINERRDMAQANELCLFENSEAVDVQGFGSGSYRCSPTIFEQYDEFLDELDLEENFKASRDDHYFFAGQDELETDIGKWSDYNLAQPIFCYHEFDDLAPYGEKFSWISVAEAANKNQLFCEIYLGYNWTGSKCCGIDDSTYNDPEKECDAQREAFTIAQTMPFSSPAFESTFLEVCNITAERNDACFQGTPLSEFATANTTETRFDVYNLNGTLHFCNIAQGGLAYPEFPHDEKCTILREEDSPEFAMCAYTNDSWFNAYDSAVYFGYDSSMETENLQDEVHISQFPVPGLSYQQEECCFQGSCWNGSACVHRQGLNEGVYQFSDGTWQRYSGEAEPGSQIYICHEGEWITTFPKYNWYYDTNYPNFCSQKHACYCSGPATEPYDYGCGEGNVDVESCTTQENFFKDDHYCQAQYDTSGNVMDAGWTSRTKLVAQQLIALAGNDDYTLYCDKLDNSVNYGLPLQATAYPLNNVCIVEYADKRVIGFSFNPDGTTPDPMQDFLFSQTSGFASVILDTNLESCTYTSQGLHGTYSKCDGNIWVNNRTLSVLFSKTGISAQSSLPAPDFSALDSAVGQELTILRNAIAQQSGLPANMGLISSASNLDRFYIMKKQQKLIIGFVEKRYDQSVQPVPLNNFMAVHYYGFSDVCSPVDFARQHDIASLYCIPASTGSIVLGKSTLDTPPFWKDLTSKLRI